MNLLDWIGYAIIVLMFLFIEILILSKLLDKIIETNDSIFLSILKMLLCGILTLFVVSPIASFVVYWYINWRLL